MGKWKRAATAIGTGGFKEIYRAGKKYANAKKDAANEAAKRQQALYNTAIRQNAFGDSKYTTAQQQIMDNLISGTDPTVTQEEVGAKMQSIAPTVNQQFSNNVWSTSRAKAMTNAAQNAQDALVASKKASQQSALDALRQEAANRGNLLVGQAASVTPKATSGDAYMDLLKQANATANTGASLAALLA